MVKYIFSMGFVYPRKKKMKGETAMDLEMVKYLAELGKLKFTDEELEKVGEDMTSIIELMDKVKEIDVVYDPYLDNKNIFLNDLREDKNAKSLDTQKLLSNAKNQQNCFVVPKVVE